MNDIAIYGAGGFGKEIACLIYWINEVKPQWNLIGFFDDGVECETQISHYGKVLGGMDTLNSWNKSLSVVFAIANNKVLCKLSSLIDNKQIGILKMKIKYSPPKEVMANLKTDGNFLEEK